MAHHKNFKGGIQPGTVATDEKAKKLDKAAKVAAKTLAPLMEKKYPKLSFQEKLDKSQIPGGVGACAPDGGVWLYDDKIIAVFESKKQGSRGNAIERWFKNNFVIRKTSPDATYVTFTCGEGALPSGPIYKALHIAHSGGDGVFNKTEAGKNNCFYKEDGSLFSSSEVLEIMTSTIEASIEKARS